MKTPFSYAVFFLCGALSLVVTGFVVWQILSIINPEIPSPWTWFVIPAKHR